MSPRTIREVEGVNLDRDLKQYRMDDRFVSYTPGGDVSEPMSFPDAQRLAIADGVSVGFLVTDPAPAAVAPVPAVVPVPSYMRRRVKSLVTR